MGRDGHLEETLRRIVAETLLNEVEDPRVGFVTVSEVRLNRDRTMAEVFYTVLGDQKERDDSLTGLKRARGFLRQAIGDGTRMRQVPDLRFRYDDSLDRSFRVEQILEDLRSDGGESGGDDTGADGRQGGDGP